MTLLGGPLPFLLPGIAIALVVSIVVSRRVGRALRVPWLVAFVLVFSLGIILSATLTPLRSAFAAQVTGPQSCDLSRFGPAPLADYLSRSKSDAGENVAIFIPLGLAIGMIPPSRRKAALTIAAILLPVAIEAVQLLVPALGRACQSADVFDNFAGLVLGLGLGTGARRVLAGRRAATSGLVHEGAHGGSNVQPLHVRRQGTDLSSELAGREHAGHRRDQVTASFDEQVRSTDQGKATSDKQLAAGSTAPPTGEAS